MNDYKPPFHITDKMTSLIAEISEQIGRITVLQERTINPHLRRENRIRTIHSPLRLNKIHCRWSRSRRFWTAGAFRATRMRSERYRMPMKPAN